MPSTLFHPLSRASLLRYRTTFSSIRWLSLSSASSLFLRPASSPWLPASQRRRFHHRTSRLFVAAPNPMAAASTNAYTILGVDGAASKEDIRMRYLQLAKEHHPDTNPDNPWAKEQFIRIKQAYEDIQNGVASPPIDHAGSFWSAAPDQSSSSNWESQSDFYSTDWFSKFKQQQKRSSQTQETSSGFDDADWEAFFFHATRKETPFPNGKKRSNQKHQKYHQDPNSANSYYRYADGHTEYEFYEDLDEDDEEMEMKNGGKGGRSGPGVHSEEAGSWEDEFFRMYNHTKGRKRSSSPRGNIYGVLELEFEEAAAGCTVEVLLATPNSSDKPRKVAVKIPPATQSGDKVQIRGTGGHKGKPQYVLIKVRESNVFTVRGLDLSVTLQITLPHALLGGEVTVPTLHGPQAVEIPACMEPDHEIVLEEMGLETANRTERGNLHVHFQVKFPTELTKAQRECMTQFFDEGQAKGHKTHPNSDDPELPRVVPPETYAQDTEDPEENSSHSNERHKRRGRRGAFDYRWHRRSTKTSSSSSRQHSGQSPNSKKTNGDEDCVSIDFEQAARGCTLTMPMKKLNAKSKSSRKVCIQIPPGTVSGDRIIIQGKSKRSGAGRTVVVYVRESNVFTCQGMDLHLTMEISLSQALLGGGVEVPTLHEPVMVSLLPCTCSDTVTVVEGLGIKPRASVTRDRNGTPECGCLNVTWKVRLPGSLTPEQRHLLELYMHDDPEACHRQTVVVPPAEARQAEKARRHRPRHHKGSSSSGGSGNMSAHRRRHQRAHYHQHHSHSHPFASGFAFCHSGPQSQQRQKWSFAGRSRRRNVRANGAPESWWM